MIVFQSSPCRLYPDIVRSIQEQFFSVNYIHEVFSLVDDGQYKNENNKLEITPNNYKFNYCDFTCGIFDGSKIIKNKDDFWFTIKMDEETAIHEYFCAIRYFSSYDFIKYKRDAKSLCLYSIFNDFFKNKKDECIISMIRNRDLPIFDYRGVKYKFREVFLSDDSNFDYIGDFNNWSETIKEISELTGLNISNLEKENTFSYKKN